MYHKITLVGRLGGTPECKYTEQGKAVTNFSLAVDCGFGSNKKTMWVRVSCWEKTAEAVNTYCDKGSVVLVEGQLRPGDDGSPRTYDSKGTTKASYEVTAQVVRFIGGKKGDAAPADGDDLPF